MRTYTPPTQKPYDDWHNAPDARGVQVEASHPEYIPTPRQLPVIEETKKALEQLEKAGKYPYNSDVNKIVCAALGVDMTDPIINPSKDYNVQHGIMGADIYYARRYLDTQKRVTENRDTIKAFDLLAGMEIGQIKINGKQAKACAIKEVSKYGANISFTLGSKKYEAHFDSLVALIGSVKAAGNPIFANKTEEDNLT